ncbi:hypothetical protein HK102_001411, partial [Quaeritorhiza haematococci]
MPWNCKRHKVPRHAAFLSYRVATEERVLEQLHPLLERVARRRKGLPIPFFWDKLCLNDGENFQVGFTTALLNSDAVLYVISQESVEIMATNVANRSQDNVLIEIEQGLTTSGSRCVPVVLKPRQGKQAPETDTDRPGKGIGDFISFVFKTIPEGSIHVASGADVHQTLRDLFKNNAVVLDLDQVHNFVYDILNVIDPPRVREFGEDVCTSVRQVPESYLGRIVEFNTVWECLANHGSCLIAGSGGIGKSCLAAKVARDLQHYYNHVLWVSCETLAVAREGFQTIAGQVGIRVGEREEDVVQRLNTWFANEPKYLLVMDNVDRSDVVYADNGKGGVFRYMRKLGGFRGDVIVTTRDQTMQEPLRQYLGLGLPVNEVSVDRWNLDITRRFLLQRAPKINQLIEDQSEMAAFELLVREVDGYPLAAEQTAAYIRSRPVSIAKCRERLFDRVLDPEQDLPDAEIDQSRDVLGCIVSLQVDAITSDSGQEGRLAALLLGVISFFGHESIPSSLLNIAAKKLPNWVQSWDISDIFQPVFAQSLLRQSSGNLYSTHGLLHALLTKTCRTPDCWRLALVTLESCMPSDTDRMYDHDAIVSARVLLPHVQAFLKESHSVADKQDEEVFHRLLNKTFHFAFYVGNYAYARDVMEHELELSVNQGGRHHGQTLYNLANVARMQGNYQAAEEHFTQSLHVRKKAYGTGDHQEVSDSLKGMAVVAETQSNYKTAQDLFNQCLEIELKIHGTRSRLDIAETIRGLGRIAFAQGDSRTAEKFYTEALEIQEKVYGTRDHLDVAATLHQLGNVCDMQGDYQKAESIYTEAMQIRVKAYGTRDHPEVARTLHNLGIVADSQGVTVKAERLFTEALKSKEKAYGTRDHSNVAVTLHALGNVACKQGEYPKAEGFYKEALVAQEKAFGTRDNPKVAMIVCALGDVAYKMGDFRRAEELYAEALEIEEKTFGGRDHPDVARTLHNLGNLAFKTGDYTKAKKLFSETLRIKEKVYGKRSHPGIVVTLHQLASVASRLGDYGQAEELFMETLEIEEKVQGFRPAPTLHVLGDVVLMQGDSRRAEEIYNEALRMEEKTYGTRVHPDVARTLQNLGDLALKQRELTKAEHLLSESLQIKETLLGTRDHPVVAPILQSLGEVASSQGSYQRAETLFTEALQIWQKSSRTENEPQRDLNIARTLHYLGTVSFDLGEYVAAEDRYREAMRAFEGVYGTRVHEDVATVLEALGDVAKQRREVGRAAEFYRECLA